MSSRRSRGRGQGVREAQSPLFPEKKARAKASRRTVGEPAECKGLGGPSGDCRRLRPHPGPPMSGASLEGTGWGQGKVAGHHLPVGVRVSPSPRAGRSETPGAPRLRPCLLPDGHWASARHSVPGLIPKQNIWFPGLMALKCKYCFSVSNKQSHTGSRSPELATQHPPPLVRACRSGPSAPNTLEWGRDPLTGFISESWNCWARQLQPC